MASSTLKAREAQFREDIAAQFRGLDLGDVTVSADRVVLELESAGEGPLRVVAGLNEDHVGRSGWADWLQLRVEGEWITPLLTLAWFDGGIDSLERRIDPDLPLKRRGLNAPADIREGRYARGDVLDRLRADLEALTGHAAPRQSRALARTDPPAHAVAVAKPAKVSAPDNVIDAEFTPVAPPVVTRNDTPGNGRMPSVDEVKEMLIAATFEALQHELLSREAALRGAGALSSVKAKFLEALEWAMVATAYAVEELTSRTAIGTFMPGDAGWLYGLVGPVVNGGLGALAQGKFQKSVAAALMASWALAVGSVTASDETYLNGAQAWFPKGEAVRRQEQALNLARVEQTAAEKEVARLEAKTGLNVAGAITEARRQWQADKIERDAAAQRRQDAEALQKAQSSLKDASGRVVHEETALRKAMAEDPSRREAWAALFAIFAIINFAGPYAISRVLAKWRNDHASAKADAESGHHARESAKLLRGSPDAQKTRAMRLFADAIEKMGKDGMAPDVLNQINGAEVAATAAERFNRSINPARLSGLNRN